MKIRNDSADGGKLGESAVVKSSQVSVQSIPDRSNQVVQESITSSKRSQMSLEDHDVHRVLEDFHKDSRDYDGRNDSHAASGGAGASSASPTRVTFSEVSNTRDAYSRDDDSQDNFPRNGEMPYGKETSEKDYSLEDIEAELVTLREELERAREVRQGGGDVVYVSEDVANGSPTRSRSPEGGGRSGRRMVITTSSYARVPRQGSMEKWHGSQDNKVSKLIEMFNKPDQGRNSRKRANSGGYPGLRGHRGHAYAQAKPKIRDGFRGLETGAV